MMHPLHLRPNLAGWALFNRRKRDKAFLPIKEKVMTRDANTCQFCGFQATLYLDVVNLDGNYRNNKSTNMVTACPFCIQCQFLQSVGADDMSGGQLILLPEMSQAELNGFCHVLFCAIDNSSNYQEMSQSVYRSFKFRSQPIESQFGKGMSDPALMGQLLIEYRAHKPSVSLAFMRDMRLLPSHNKFKRQLDAWAESALAEIESDSMAAT